jgi:hypothetical protein
MARSIAKPLPLVGLGTCLTAAGLTWERAARALFISPATLRSYTSRGAPQAMVVALTLLLDLPRHSPRSLFVRSTEGLGMRTAPEPHRAHHHQPALRPAEERETGQRDDTPGLAVTTSDAGRATAPPATWEQLPMAAVAV